MGIPIVPVRGRQLEQAIEARSIQIAAHSRRSGAPLSTGRIRLLGAEVTPLMGEGSTGLEHPALDYDMTGDFSSRMNLVWTWLVVKAAP